MHPHESAFDRLRSLQVETILAGSIVAELRPRFASLRDRHENGTAPRAVSVHQLFQTPASLAARLVALLPPARDGRVLEPSAGLGRILDALAPYKPAEVVAVELAAPCAGELFRQDRPGVRIHQRDFLTLTPADLGTFDAIVMNPPFHLRADIRHILHARQFLKPGGTLAAVCLNSTSRISALQPFCQTWVELPRSTFAAEGTHVSTALLTMTG